MASHPTFHNRFHRFRWFAKTQCMAMLLLSTHRRDHETALRLAASDYRVLRWCCFGLRHNPKYLPGSNPSTTDRCEPRNIRLHHDKTERRFEMQHPGLDK